VTVDKDRPKLNKTNCILSVLLVVACCLSYCIILNSKIRLGYYYDLTDSRPPEVELYNRLTWLYVFLFPALMACIAFIRARVIRAFVAIIMVSIIAYVIIAAPQLDSVENASGEAILESALLGT